MAPTREDCIALDRTDSLAAFRERFVLPPDVLYFDGNSLGPLPRATAEMLADAVTKDWGAGLVRSWNAAGWSDLPRRLGDRIARLIGAAPGTTIACDSTSVNLYKVLVAALALRPDRPVVLSERDTFPTDLYVAEGALQAGRTRRNLRLAEAGELLAALDDSVAVLMLSHVNYRTGAMHDLQRLTAAAHAAGALVIWDLAHTAGAMPVALEAHGTDFAVGCGYKYLNGGPGAPAFVYAAPRLQEDLATPLSGWFGHARPFAFETAFTPAPGIARLLCGTPPVLSMLALEAGVDLLLEADLAAVRTKSLALFDLFTARVDTLPADSGLRCVTPLDPARRGSQVCYAHGDAWPVMQALIAEGVIGDYREPGILRFGLTPLTLRFVDVYDAVERLGAILATRRWDREAFHRRNPVT